MKKFTFIIIAGILIIPSENLFSQTITFVHKGNSRNCIVHLPSSYNPSNSYPLVFNLHGFGSASWQQELYTGMDAIADTAGFIVAYPDAVSSTWDVIFTDSPIDDVGYINILLDSLIDRYTVDTTRIYATGMSMGGFMTYRLGCEMSNHLAAIASVAGPSTDSVLIACNSSRIIPVMHIHGTDDNTVPYAGDTLFNHIDSTIQYFVNKNGCSTPVVYDFPNTNTSDGCTVTSYYYCKGEDSAEVLFYKVIGGEHTWPGSIIPIGVTNQDINASEEIWKFFRKHQLKQTTTSISNPDFSEMIQVFPNPTSRKVKIELPENILEGSLQIQLFDMTCKSLQSFGRSEFQNNMEIDLRDCNEGIYLVRIIMEQNVYQSLVVVNR